MLLFLDGVVNMFLSSWHFYNFWLIAIIHITCVIKNIILIFQFFTLPYRCTSDSHAIFFNVTCICNFDGVSQPLVNFYFICLLLMFPLIRAFFISPSVTPRGPPHVGVQTSANGGIKSTVITNLWNFSTAQWRHNFEWGSWTGEFNLKWKRLDQFWGVLSHKDSCM